MAAPIADQVAQAGNPVEMEAGMTNLADMILKEHQVVKTLYEDFKEATDLAAKQQICWELIRQMSQHGHKEEEVLYPALEKIFGPGHSDHLLDQHMSLKKMMAELDGMTADQDPDKFTSLCTQAVQAFLAHIVEEEGQEIPALNKLGADELMSLAKQWMEASLHAPTRPHPEAPVKPPACVEAHRMSAPLDHAADQFRFGTHPSTTGSAAAP